jgi:hypothetical protein
MDDAPRALAEYEAGYRFGRAWLCSGAGREWRAAADQQGAVMFTAAMRTLARDNSREYLRGFYEAANAGEDPPPPDLSRPVPATRSVRVSLAFTAEEEAALKGLRAVDGVPMTVRLRALLWAYRTDAHVRTVVDDVIRRQPED